MLDSFYIQTNSPSPVNPYNQYLPPIPAYPITRANHPFKFQHYTSRTTMYRNSFFPRTIPEWNKLPSATIAESDDLNLFKRNLSNYNA